MNCVQFGLAIISQHGIDTMRFAAGIDVLEGFQDRFGRRGTLGAEMPLQIADPEDQFGDGDGAGVDFQAEELVGVYGEAAAFEEFLGLAELAELVAASPSSFFMRSMVT